MKATLFYTSCTMKNLYSPKMVAEQKKRK